MAKSATTSRQRASQRLATRAEKALKKNPSFQFSPEALERLTQLEADARLEAQTNPDLQLGFTEIQTFLQQWAALNPEEQERLGTMFQEQANALVDIPFDKQIQTERDNLSSALKRLDTNYKFFREGEEEKLKSSIDGLDRDTVVALTQAFEDVESRGLGNSGAMRQIADQIIGSKIRTADEARQIVSTNIGNGRTILGLNVTDLNRGTQLAEEGINQERTVAREVKKNDLVGGAIQKSLLQQVIGGGTELDFRTFKPEIDPVNPASLPTPDTVATTPAATVTPAQRIRNIRMRSVPTPVPATPAPVAPVQSELTPLQQAVIRRRQARVDKLPKI